MRAATRKKLYAVFMAVIMFMVVFVVAASYIAGL